MGLQSSRYYAKAGDFIRVTVDGFPKGIASVYLFDEEQAKTAQQVLDTPGDLSAIGCTYMAKLQPSNCTVSWEIEQEGVWFVVIDDREILKATCELTSKSG